MSIMMCVDCFKMIDTDYEEKFSVKDYYKNAVLDKYEATMCQHCYEEYKIEEKENDGKIS